MVVNVFPVAFQSRDCDDLPALLDAADDSTGAAVGDDKVCICLRLSELCPVKELFILIMPRFVAAIPCLSKYLSFDDRGGNELVYCFQKTVELELLRA